jgi:hypothetical protein
MTAPTIARTPIIHHFQRCQPEPWRGGGAGGDGELQVGRGGRAELDSWAVGPVVPVATHIALVATRLRVAPRAELERDQHLLLRLKVAGRRGWRATQNAGIVIPSPGGQVLDRDGDRFRLDTGVDHVQREQRVTGAGCAAVAGSTELCFPQGAQSVAL